MNDSIEMNTENENKKNWLSSFFDILKYVFTNRTFIYILRRILSSLITIVLLIAVVTALIRLLPETMFYDVGQFTKLGGDTIYPEDSSALSLNWKYHQLSLYGRCDADGTPKSVLFSIFQYIYWILPIPKEIVLSYELPSVANHMACDIPHEVKTFLCYFGQSKGNGNKLVTELLSEKMGISMKISLISTALTYVFAIPLGVAMAKKPGGVIDKIGNVFIVLNYAIPALVFYLLMRLWLGDIPGLNLGILYHEDQWQTLVPPIFCIVFLSIPGVCIWIRRFMLDELSSDYVKFARSKGLSENKILYKHVFRNACVPLVRNLPATFLGSILGSYYVEDIWNIPGTGFLLIKSLQGTPDVQVVQGLTVIYAAISMLSFLLGDIVTVLFDPRISLVSE